MTSNELLLKKEAVKRLTNIINLQAKPMQEDWINKQTEKGRIHSHFQRNFVNLVAAIEFTFPGKWDLTMDSRSRSVVKKNYIGVEYEEFEYFYLPQIMIYFPEFEITNTRGNKHSIKDLFVRIRSGVRDGNTAEFSFNQFQGDRSTLTFEEYVSDYRHSHINGYTLTDPSYRCNFSSTDFCTGDSEFGVLLMEFENLFYKESTDFWSEEQFKLFFMTLDSFILHESLEGVPYKYISTIGERKEVNPVSDNTITDQGKDLLLHIFKRENLFNTLNWGIHSNNLVLIDSNYEDYILNNEQLVEELSNTTTAILYATDERDKFYNIEDGEQVRGDFEDLNHFIKFRGENYYFKVEGNTPRPILSQIRKKINPYVISKFKQSLQLSIQQEEVRRNLLERVNKSRTPFTIS